MGPNWGQDADGPPPSTALLPRLFLQGHNQGRLRLLGKQGADSLCRKPEARAGVFMGPWKVESRASKKRELSGAQNYRALEFLFLGPGNKGAATTTLRGAPSSLFGPVPPHPIWLVYVICVSAESLTPHLH